MYGKGEGIPSNPQTLVKGHTGPIYTVRFNNVGEYCMTGSEDRSVCLYNPSKNLMIKNYKNLHNYDVCCLDIGRDNSKFITGGGDKTLILTDVVEGKTIRKFLGHNGRVNSINFNADNNVIFSGSYDTTVQIWDHKSNSTHSIQIIKGFKDSVCKVQNREYEIICGSMDGSVRFYDIRNGKFVSDQMSEPIQSMDLSNSGQAYVASCTNNRMYLIQRKSGNKIIEYSGHNCQNYKIDCIFNKRDSQILTGSVDGKLYVYDIMKKQAVKVFEICDKPISSIDVHENVGYLTAGHDGNVTFWKC